MRKIGLACFLAFGFMACGSDTPGTPDAAADAFETIEDAAPGDEAPGDVATDERPTDEAMPEDATDAGPDTVEPPARRIDEVNLYIGTGLWGLMGFGGAYPGATMPFGMIHPGPDTGRDTAETPILHVAGYFYGDDKVQGFSNLHIHGIGAPDYGYLLFQPTVGMDDTKTRERGYVATFDHASETLHPGYYAVTMEPNAIRAELTCTDRAAIHRYTWKEGDDAVVLFDVGHARGGRISDASITVDPETGRMEGHATLQGGLSGRGGVGGIKTYFAAQIDRPIGDHGLWVDGVLDPDATTADVVEVDSEDGVDVGVYLHVTPDEAGQARIRIAVSYIGVAEARANLEAELDDWDFDRVEAAAGDAWEDVLARASVEGGTADQRAIYYTALYHSFLMPVLFTDADGRYRGFDREVHDAGDATFYSNFSLWDTYRTLHPLLTLLVPDVQRDMVVSLVRMYEQGGFFPRWPIGLGESGSMIGESAFIVLADSYVKGVTDFDTGSAWAGIVSSSKLPADGGTDVRPRDCLATCLAAGYCPADQCGSSVSKTMEYAFDDFAVAQFAEALGKTDEAAIYRARADAWRGLWWDEKQYFWGRNADGSFVEPFDALAFVNLFTEGNAWQYRFFVPFDVAGLVDVFGSDTALVDALAEFFEESVPETEYAGSSGPHYWHGNEPDIHSAYVFAEAGRPDLTQRWARWIADEKYRNAPDGLDGNDDCGTLSAWYVFTALGLYPIPAKDVYVIGSPMFDRATLRLSGGDLVVSAEGAGPDAVYVQSVTFDGTPWTEPTIPHATLAAGGELHFVMGTEPSDWGQPAASE